ncbi:hypothetical protein [Nocardiopsis sp. LOL_012]
MTAPEEPFKPVLWLVYMAHTAVPALRPAWTQPDEAPDGEDG